MTVLSVDPLLGPCRTRPDPSSVPTKDEWVEAARDNYLVSLRIRRQLRGRCREWCCRYGLATENQGRLDRGSIFTGYRVRHNLSGGDTRGK